MSDARAAILSRLRQAPSSPVPPPGDWAPPTFGDGKTDRFRAMLEAVHGEVHEVAEATWPQVLAKLLADKGVTKLLCGMAMQPQLTQALGPSIAVEAYDQDVEVLKDMLVHDAQAALTTANAGIAETGSLVLWPTSDEPRLLSLLPPIHVAVLKKAHLADTLAELMAREEWAGRMPTNLVLVSGPSKTADIEQTLAYGVHGPKELIVLVIG